MRSRSVGSREYGVGSRDSHQADLLAWLERPDGPLPATPVGGTTSLSSGKANFIELDVTPGDHALRCFEPDATDGQPHIAYGMVKQIMVG